LEEREISTSISIFDEDGCTIKEQYDQVKLKNDLDMLRFFKQFIKVEEENRTPYKHKLGYYKKKAHYINGRKVNRYVYQYVKNWLEDNR